MSEAPRGGVDGPDRPSDASVVDDARNTEATDAPVIGEKKKVIARRAQMAELAA